MNSGLNRYRKNKIYHASKLDIKKIKDKLNNYDIVSFDLFDTLIKRNVYHPTDIFTLMERIANNTKALNIRDFKVKRIIAEKKARENCKRKEINLDEIYSSFDDGIIASNAIYLQELEESIEIKLCSPHKEVQELYYWCLENRKKIILISDMYLSLETIEEMLKKCGYEGYEEIYLSSNNDARKLTGELYNMAKSELSITSKSICHIGDSFKSDGKKAREEGIYSIVIPLNINRTTFFDTNKIDSKTNFDYSQLYKFCNNNIDSNWGIYKKFGYETFGIILYGFGKWLLNELKHENVDRVFFFSRDGLIMKQAFDCVNNSDNIESYYLEVSRRSLRVPQLWMNPEYEKVIQGFSAASVNNVRGFFDTLGLDLDNYHILCDKLGIPLDYKFKKKDMLNNKLLIELYSKIKEDVIDNSKKEYDTLLRYLNKNNFNGKVAVVDIGWRGSMQKFLINVLQNTDVCVDMKGYYVGLASGAREYSKEIDIDFKGYAFDCNKNSNEKDIRQPFVGLIETLFLARTGSCKSYYIKENDEIGVNYYENEYYENGELTSSAKRVVEIQEGALRFISDFIKVNKDNYFNISPLVAIENLRRIGISPTSKELMMFADMEFLDGDIGKLASPASIFKYITNPKKLINDFYSSRWKIGFMKRMLKLPLPYEKIYEIMKKI